MRELCNNLGLVDSKTALPTKFYWSALSSIWLPALLVAVYLVFTLLLKDILPGPDEILQRFETLFGRYGYEIIFFGAFLEAALIIDLFVPGSSVVLAGAYFASRGIISYPIFLAVSAAGFFLGFLLDYLIGYYGWSDILRKLGLGRQLQAAERKVERHQGRALFIGYFHPDSASLFAVAAGIIKMKFKTFVLYSWLAGSLWLIFWTGLVFILGSQLERIFDNQLLIIGFILTLMLVMFAIFRRF